MCGITGIASRDPGDFSSDIAAMTDALKHRGPDDGGYVVLSPAFKDKAGVLTRQDYPAGEKAEIFLGYRRLSIIDVSGTRQPLANEDKSVWTVFNGEIYNYLELREFLKAKGHVFREQGDTEVLVHLWEEYGHDMLRHLTGMFAFAIYDLNKNTLFLARDRFGQKPLFYRIKNDFIAFASEIQSLWQLDDFPEDQINDLAVARFFKYGYIPGPETVYRQVYSLPPGSFLNFNMNNGEFSINSYWKPKVCGDIDDVSLTGLEEHFDRSVKYRLISDVPLGLFLSGGIDSSLIASSMKKQSPNTVKTFTISTDSIFDESDAAARIASFLGTEHHESPVEPDLVDVSGKLASHYGQPFADYSSVPTYYVSRETARHVKVALGGDGGDELFAGYNRYQNMNWTAFCGMIPYPLRFLISRVLKYTGPKSYYSTHLTDYVLSCGPPWFKGENPSLMFHHYMIKKCFQPDFMRILADAEHTEINLFEKYYNEASSAKPLEKWLEVDQRMYLCDDILAKVDIASMACSLECRAPFLDHNLAEYANRISLDWKIKKGRTKYILRELAKEALPPGISDLPKKGFTLPLAKWLRNELKDWACSLVFDSGRCWKKYLKEDMVRVLWNEHMSGRMDNSMRLWMIISFELWYKALQDRRRVE